MGREGVDVQISDLFYHAVMYNVLLYGSKNMGDHCAHVESTIGRAHNIFYRDIPYAPHETRR